MRKNTETWQLTLSYCKNEFICSSLYLFFTVIIFMLFIFSNIFVSLNEYSLPYRILFEPFPFAGYLTNWFLNYAYQFYFTFFGGMFFFILFIINLNIMDHSCWGADITILLVHQLDRVLDDEDNRDAARILRREIVNKKLKKIIDMTYRVVYYHDRVQCLIKLIFFFDLTLTSLLLCICVFTITEGIFSLMLLLPSMLSQIFISCWIGNRVIVRYEALVDSLYDVKWYLMEKQHQKDLQLVILRAQHLSGYNGIFKTVSLATFQNVC